MIRKLKPAPSTNLSVQTLGSPAVPTHLAAGGQSREVELRNLWRTLWRRRVPFLATFLSFVALVAAMTLLQPKAYTTQVRMIAGNTNPAGGQTTTGSDLSVLNALMLQVGGQTPQTFAELLHESPVAQEVIRRLKLPMGPDQLLGHVTVNPVTDTPIISLAVTWPDRTKSAQIANEFANVFVDRERQLISHQADSAIGFLQQQLPIAEDHLRQAQSALAAYQKKTGIADLTSQTDIRVRSAAELDAKAQAAEIESKQAAAQLASVQSELATTPATIQGQKNVAANPVAGQLQQQVAQATVDLNEARAKYTDSHPAVVAAKARLAELKRELAQQPSTVVSGTDTVPNPIYQQLIQQRDTLQGTISAAHSQIAGLANQRSAAERGLQSLPDQARRIAELTRSVANAQSVYQSLTHKFQDANLARTTALSDVTITQPADAAVYTKSPNVALNLSIGLLLGLLLGITAAFGIDFFDDRLQNEEEVRERTGLPLLATIPQLGALTGKDHSWVESLTVESFFELVTQLRNSSENPPRIITITSPQQGDGKSTIAINVAISMASLNAKILVIDADLRRPTIHSKLRISNDVGLSDVLVGIVPFSEAIKPSGHENVWTVTGGTRPPNPVALLQSESFDRLLLQAREMFDFVVVDAPALGPIVDGLIVGMKSDGTVLVVSATNTDGRAAQSAIAKLRSVSSLNILGVVLNHVKAERRTDSDYYLGGGQTISLPTLDNE
ncbi:MAG: GumC family protein [Vulcanimicrobiaceae bacterium]